MLNRIISALSVSGADAWRVTELKTYSAELYYIKKQLDIPRVKNMTEYSVEVFRDFEQDGVKYRGFTTIPVPPGTGDSELKQRIDSALFAASFVKNRWFELPEGIKRPHAASASELRRSEPQDAARRMAEAIFAADTDRDAFVNSAEIFVTRRSRRIVASNGLEVGYDEDKVSGELVVQCIAPKDVEQYRSFSYDGLDTEALTQKVRDAIRDVRLRAAAEQLPKAGTYDIILTGENLRTVLDYYLSRSNAAMIYPKYSGWDVGTDVQGEGITGEALELGLVSTQPYSEEGIPMPSRTLVHEGRLELVHGATRFCRYLGKEPTGNYYKLSCMNGTMSYADMQKEGVLEAVSFSDFQMDSFSGHFGGEIRLALLHGADGAAALTGGSVNGSLQDVQAKLIFSKERFTDGSYDGPMAVLIPGVAVAGE